MQIKLHETKTGFHAIVIAAQLYERKKSSSELCLKNKKRKREYVTASHFCPPK